ncbi:MAG TPA: type I-U CRISPR-associated helicase/endonuclease Cas3 [Myxococcota bacterium]|nr:type I-U CRISPR-associated helicase/endonuclease Cas3 [Myxococcota bacterium]
MTFEQDFECLTGHEPFPWQRALFDEFKESRFPKDCGVPTGLGKTAAISIWLLALSHHARDGALNGFPRRLAYVVNRRTVVDQATREAEHMRQALVTKPELRAVAEVLHSIAAQPSESPLAISTLRGQFADNAEWRNDPTRPSVIVGTVDMIGSRLLFSGYGCGFKYRPVHAGFLGQDTLLIHDEAHLEPAFQEIIEAIEAEQQRCHEFGRFRVMALTATSRDDAQSFGLTDAERKPESDTKAGQSLREVWKRTTAKKGIAFHETDGKNVKTVDKVTELAMAHKGSGNAILIFLRKLEDVEKVTNHLRKAKLPVQVLTGTLRGLERDAMASKDVIFARFMLKSSAAQRPDTVYLVCTSAGEVGVDISADHLVCDLTPFESMAQRFGRVNRFGNGDAKIDLVYQDAATAREAIKKEKPPSPFDQACERTLALLNKLPRREDGLLDASPAALGNLPATERRAAFTPAPVIPPASDMLFDAWALTSIRQRLPGRPPVADWLHGVAEWEPPETHITWREEVEIVTDNLGEKYKPRDLLDDYPLKPHEMLRDRTDRVFKHLERLAEQHVMSPVWVVGNDELLDVTTLGKMVDAGKDALSNVTLLLPPKVGGLTKEGMLDGTAVFDECQRYDIADLLVNQDKERVRIRVWDDEPVPRRMRPVRIIDTTPDAGGETDEGEQANGRHFWHWYVRPSGSRTASKSQGLDPHLLSAESFAKALVSKLGLEDTEALAITLAARHHDRGKQRTIWQRSIGNRDYPNKVLAKSGGRMRPIELNHYRHEFGSIIDITCIPEFAELGPEVQDLLIHVIAAHHGRARPCFPADEVFDPERAEQDVGKIAQKVPRRFARLERKYGRWGLAYLESLVRAADALASQEADQ